MSKAIVFFADGTEECEALLVVDLLRRAGVQVVMASAGTQKEIVSSHDIHLWCNTRAAYLNGAEADLFVLPGGIPGTPNLAANKDVVRILHQAQASGKKIAAICAAPSILGGLGMLDGKKATAHTAFRDQLGKAEVVDAEVVVDGNITTSYGLGAAIPFALELVRQLEGEDAAAKVRAAIDYRH